MKRRTLTQHTVRCPLDEVTASVTVQTDPHARPSRRYRDVTACSLQPPTGFMPFVRRGYFSDVAPPVAYVCDADPAPCHTAGVTCSKACLAILNAAEPGAAELICTSGIHDALELARQTQTPAIARLLYYHAG